MSELSLAGRRVLMMAGGTGGHVIPGISVAQALQARGAVVTWLGTRAGIESRLVPGVGIEIDWLSVGGLRGKRLATRLAAPLRLLAACAQAWWVLRRRRPELVIGMGGFAAGPGGLVAKLTGRKLLLHEQNAVAGLTNRWLARIADRVLEAFPDALPRTPRARRAHVGNPVRVEMQQPLPMRRRTVDMPLRVLVIGGSRGALALNAGVPEAIAQLPTPQAVAVRHQCGERDLAATRERYRRLGLSPAGVEPFIDDMRSAYGWCDVAVCRAGALTVAELACVGRPAVLVPFPYAVDDHQTWNARYLTDGQAAELVPQGERFAARLAAALTALLHDPERACAMARRARRLALPTALDRVAAECAALLGATV